jgi:hypothetical protein
MVLRIICRSENSQCAVGTEVNHTHQRGEWNVFADGSMSGLGLVQRQQCTADPGQYEYPAAWTISIGTHLDLCCRHDNFGDSLTQSWVQLETTEGRGSHGQVALHALKYCFHEGFCAYENVSKSWSPTISYLPLSNRRKSKFVLLSNIRLSWEAVTMLRICRCRYSRWALAFLCEIRYQLQRAQSWIYSQSTLALPMRRRRHSRVEIFGGR